MRIHTSAEVDYNALLAAQKLARVNMEVTHHGSRSHAQAWDVHLTGESRRRPNGGNRGAGDDYAATWDQWGVFLAALFKVDPKAKSYAYDGAADFDYRTDCRFIDGWPEDAHGDHKFKYNGTPRERECTKCSAVQRWSA